MSQYEEVRVKRFDDQQAEIFGGQTTVSVLPADIEIPGSWW